MLRVLSTFALLASLVAADVTPTAPGPNETFAAGSDCSTAWKVDQSGSWKNMTIKLMSGSNDNMSLVAVAASGLDGTSPKEATYNWTCPEVDPYSAIYFYEFSNGDQPASEWTTRFTITSPSGKFSPPEYSSQPNGDAIPWGTGRLLASTGSSASPPSSDASGSASPSSSSSVSSGSGSGSGSSSSQSSTDESSSSSSSSSSTPASNADNDTAAPTPMTKLKGGAPSPDYSASSAPDSDEEQGSQEGQQASQGGGEPCASEDDGDDGDDDDEQQTQGTGEDSEDEASSSELPPVNISEPVEVDPVSAPSSSSGEDDGDEEPASGGSSGSSSSRGGSASPGSAGYTGSGGGSYGSGSLHSVTVDRLFPVVVGGAVALLLV